MAELNITIPAKIKIVNTSDKAKSFVPYKENFTTVLGAGYTVEFNVKHSSQVLYYLGQATEGLEVSKIDNFDAASDTVVIIEAPADVTLTNTSDKEIGFVPYKENFTSYIKAGDSVKLTARHVGIVLYYLAQATEGLEVTQEVAANADEI